MSKNLIYDISDKPPMSKRLIFAFQQFLAILSATIAVPSLIGLPTQIPAAIFGAGLGTLVYQLFTKFKIDAHAGYAIGIAPHRHLSVVAFLTIALISAASSSAVRPARICSDRS